MKEYAGCGLKKNDLFEMEIDDFGSEGEGIGHYEGFAFFVKDAVPGDIVRARVLKLKTNYGFARIEQILKPSKDRVEPRCSLARQCGGCQMQHVSYARQLEYKQEKVRTCLERIGGIKNPVLEPILGMQEPFYYRNKAQFPVGTGKDGHPAIGFYAGRTHTIIDTKHCCIQAEINEELIAAVREYLEECHISLYDEKSQAGLVRHILTRIGFSTGEVMVCMIINGTKLPKIEVLKDKLLVAVQHYNQKEKNGRNSSDSVEEYRLASLCLNINQERTNVILGRQIITYYGNNYIQDRIGAVKYQISPLSFYQVNPCQTLRLYEQALIYADLHGNEVVWDLYCGIGTISLFLAKSARQVYGVEIVPQAIMDARKNAALNEITNAEFFIGAAEEILPQKYKESGGTIHADVVVLDPPRKGCEENLLAVITAIKPARIVYVSCDPATLARDVKYLTEHGYEYVKGRVVDQFGMSGHVETVCLLSQTAC